VYESSASWPARLRSQSLPARLGLLALVVLLLLPVIGSIAWSQRGGMGVVAALIAGAICWFGASVALGLAGLGSSSGSGTSPAGNPMVGMLAGMIFRMGLPLAAGAVLHFRVPALRDAGILLSLTGFYLATLPIETWLSLPLVEKRTCSTRPNDASPNDVTGAHTSAS
jgi:hypothetical protein